MPRLIKILSSFTLAVLAVWAGYAFGPDAAEWIGTDGLFTKPCSRPIPYSIGKIDGRFDVDQDELLETIKKAAAIWEGSAGRQLFAHSAMGGVVISLTYDERQAATDQLKDMGLEIKNSRQSYESLKAGYETAETDYEKQKSRLDQEITEYEKIKSAYGAEVNSWNRKGGAPKADFDRLQTIKAKINSQAGLIMTEVNDLNQKANELNAMAHVLNKLIRELNLQVVDFNQIGEARSGREYQEAVYAQNKQGKSIEIFEFSSKDMLLRVITHELGHALGLEHTKDPADVMYYLNEGGNSELSANDLHALKSRCGI